MKNLLIGLFALNSALVFAGDFKESIYIKGYFNPDVEHIQKLTELCNTESEKISLKLKSVAEANGIDLSSLKVVPHIQESTSDTTGPAYFCFTQISGNSDKTIELVTLSTLVNHLKNKGYSKNDFSKACDSISKAFSTNPNEINQTRKVSFALINGNYCSVQSTILITKP